MYSLLYISIATQAMQLSGLKEILVYSRTRNRDHGITGCLVYIEGIIGECQHCRFIQVLEGSENEIMTLYNSIRRDPRHHSVTLIKSGLVKQRYFETWEMGFERIKLEDNPILLRFFDLNLALVSSHGDITNNMLMEFMRSFYYDLDR